MIGKMACCNPCIEPGEVFDGCGRVVCVLITVLVRFLLLCGRTRCCWSEDGPVRAAGGDVGSRLCWRHGDLRPMVDLLDCSGSTACDVGVLYPMAGLLQLVRV